MNFNLAWLMLCCVVCSGTALADSVAADYVAADSARGFGYFIGDVIKQRIQLDGAPASEELVELPETGRVGAWLDRQSIMLSNDDDNQQWLSVRYQVINSPTSSIQVSLPGFVIQLAGEQQQQINEQLISIAPLIPARSDTAVSFPAMQADQPPVLASSSHAAGRVKKLALALAVTLLLWAAWWVWRNYRDREQLPFAHALYLLQKMKNQPHDDNTQAWVALHRAFNQAAGKTVSRTTVPELLQQQPWLNPYKAGIESFFEASSERFFDETQARPSISLLELANELYRAEKKQATRRSPA